MASLMPGSIPLRAANLLKVCRHAWLGLTSLSLIPRPRIQAAKRSRAFRRGAASSGWSLRSPAVQLLTAIVEQRAVVRREATKARKPCASKVLMQWHHSAPDPSSPSLPPA